MTIKETLYGKYIKEREGALIIENQDCFAIYRFLNEKELFIMNIFVSPGGRQKGKFTWLIQQLEKKAIEAGCNHLSGNISLNDQGHRVTLIAAISLDFNLIRANGDVITIAKKVGGI